MFYYIKSDQTNPAYNLALEQYVFDELDQRHAYFMLWQNENTIVVGKHQSTATEINAAFVRQHGIQVVRRLSGGGAVYHDKGNLNFTFVVDAQKNHGFDFGQFCQPVVACLADMGVAAQISGRNDMTIDGKKFSGNSQYSRNGRLLHHGTLLFDADLEMVGNALQVSADKLESKGLKSVRSRVTNIRPFLPNPCSTADFWQALEVFLTAELGLVPFTLSPADHRAILRIKQSRYDLWDWNYGKSPRYALKKERRFVSCGKIELLMNVEHGILTSISFFGDFFGSGDLEELSHLLVGQPLEEAGLAHLLADVPIGQYFNNLSLEDFLSLILE